jgi:two-component system, NarL family, nitrate/nitrite response regulator NarL
MMLLQDILQNFVSQSEELTVSKVLPVDEDTVNEVLLESDVNGEHYYLVRCRCKEIVGAISSPENRPILSPQEQAIARLVARGFPNKQIAKELDISPWTVATHLRRIFGKLSVSSRSAMTARLLEENLL